MTNDQNENINFAVAGFGHIGKRHAEEIWAHPHGNLIAILETNEAALKQAANQYDVPVYDSLEIMLYMHPELDIVNICTPNGIHIPIATAVIDSGKNVLVEKPLALHKSDCDRLIINAVKHNKKVFCVLQNRYSPPARLIHQMVSQGVLGKIYWVAINCYWNRDLRYYLPGSWRGTRNLDGGPLYTQFSHFVDLLYWNFGSIKIIDADFFNFNHFYLKDLEDSGYFRFDINGGGAGIFTYSTALYESNLESSITIIGEKGTLKAGGQYMENIDYFKVAGLDLPELPPAMPPNNYGSYVGSAANHAIVIENVVKALKGMPYEMASAEEASASVEIIEKVYKIRDKDFLKI